LQKFPFGHCRLFASFLNTLRQGKSLKKFTGEFWK